MAYEARLADVPAVQEAPPPAVTGPLGLPGWLWLLLLLGLLAWAILREEET